MRLEEDWLLIADRGFYSFENWKTAAASAGALLWRVKADLVLPVLALLPDGPYSSVLFRPNLHDKARRGLIAAERAGEDLDSEKAVTVRVVEYSVPGREGDGKDELMALVTTIALEGQVREQVPQVSAGVPQPPGLGGKLQQSLHDRQGDQLSVAELRADADLRPAQRKLR